MNDHWSLQEFSLPLSETTINQVMEKKDEVWQIVSSKYLFRRPWLTVRCDDMLLPNGNHIPEYYILEYPDWVNTIAITKEGKFVFVRQFRPGI